MQAEMFEKAREVARAVNDNVRRVVVGQAGTTELLLVALICEGHVLLEDVPGVGKTLLARTFARSLDLTFKRVQFTPDLLPSDVTGVNFFNQKAGAFEFRPGPVFTNILLADEINRATPRTQSSLLEAMEEKQVSVDGVTYSLPRPFLVLATQNPVEMEGTFPLPEAQVDRFLIRLELGYPDISGEQEIVRRFLSGDPLSELEPVARPGALSLLKEAAAGVFVSAPVLEYLVKICRATRDLGVLRLGVSPRGALALGRTARALALLRGRHYVIPDDVKELAGPVLAHRVLLNADASLRLRHPADIIKESLELVPVPTGESGDQT
ncbi:MAG: AAA family ATPase [Bacillota bacterium]